MIKFFLAFILYAGTIPHILIPSNYCITVLISWELFCFCTIFSLFSILRKFRASIYLFSFIIFVQSLFQRSDKYFLVNSNLSIFIFSIHPSLSFWCFYLSCGLFSSLLSMLSILFLLSMVFFFPCLSLLVVFHSFVIFCWRL